MKLKASVQARRQATSDEIAALQAELDRLREVLPQVKDTSTMRPQGKVVRPPVCMKLEYQENKNEEAIKELEQMLPNFHTETTADKIARQRPKDELKLSIDLKKLLMKRRSLVLVYL
jgi:hypothetical protein